MGDCEPCAVREVVKCYCGKVEREVPCGEGEDIECVEANDRDGGEQRWFGRFDCGNTCNRSVIIITFPTDPRIRLMRH